MKKLINIFVLFKWSDNYVEQCAEKHIAKAPQLKYLSDERLAKEQKKELLRMMTEDFFSSHDELLRSTDKSSLPSLRWGFSVDGDNYITAKIDASPSEDWNQDTICQAILFIEAIIKQGNNVNKKSITISSNDDLEHYPKLYKYLEEESNDENRFKYTLNYHYLPQNNPLTI